MNNYNNIIKKLIETLTKTHPDPKTAYNETIQKAKTQEEQEHLKIIYSAIIKKKTFKQ